CSFAAFSAVTSATAEVSLFSGSDFASASASGLPHSGQNSAPASRTDAPHDEQRCEISGCIHDLLNPVHGIEQIFSLSINPHAEFFTFSAKTLLQFSRGCGGT